MDWEVRGKLHPHLTTADMPCKDSLSCPPIITRSPARFCLGVRLRRLCCAWGYCAAPLDRPATMSQVPQVPQVQAQVKSSQVPSPRVPVSQVGSHSDPTHSAAQSQSLARTAAVSSTSTSTSIPPSPSRHPSSTILAHSLNQSIISLSTPRH